MWNWCLGKVSKMEVIFFVSFRHEIYFWFNLFFLWLQKIILTDVSFDLENCSKLHEFFFLYQYFNILELSSRRIASLLPPKNYFYYTCAYCCIILASTFVLLVLLRTCLPINLHKRESWKLSFLLSIFLPNSLCENFHNISLL